MGIDTDLSKEQPTLALPPEGGDTDWPYYNNRIDGDRYLSLTEINRDNVAGLVEACRVHVSGAGPFSAGTILVHGVIYTTAWRSTLALQPTTCDVVWKALYAPEQPEVYNANRGVAYWNGKLFRGTGDDRMLAYDAATGRELWRTRMGRSRDRRVPGRGTARMEREGVDGHGGRRSWRAGAHAGARCRYR